MKPAVKNRNSILGTQFSNQNNYNCFINVKAMSRLSHFLSLYLKIFYSSGEMQHLAWLMLVILWMVQAVAGCPNVCKCSRKSGLEKTEVNCHKRGLRAFPSNLPPDAWILKLGEYFVVNQIILKIVLTFDRLYLTFNLSKHKLN